MMLTAPRIILVHTSHPGNIGAVARAMKNMAFCELYLVNPASFPHADATARASGADDILRNASVVPDIKTATEGCHWIFAASARLRSLSQPLQNPRECVQKIYEHPERKAAIIFGREQSGLTNEELSYAHYHIQIPAQAHFNSLNLAAAVQIFTYEWYMINHNGQPPRSQTKPVNNRVLANSDQLLGFYQQLQQTLIQLTFLNPKQPKMLMLRLQRLFNRAEIDETELNILRGILSMIDKKIT